MAAIVLGIEDTVVSKTDSSRPRGSDVLMAGRQAEEWLCSPSPPSNLLEESGLFIPATWSSVGLETRGPPGRTLPPRHSGIVPINSNPRRLRRSGQRTHARQLAERQSSHHRGNNVFAHSSVDDKSGLLPRLSCNE